MAIYYLDELMGRGKTSAMINYVNSAPESDRFLFITPFLTEVERIQSACSARNFVAPKEDYGKLNNIKDLLEAGHNIVSTHSLFSMFDEDAIESVARNQYTLIMDEVAPVLSPVRISENDASVISKKSNKFVAVGKDKLMTWIKTDYSGRYDIYRTLIEQGGVYQYKDEFWVRLMPDELFLSFKDVYIMTYMFEHQYQRCYFDLKGIPYERKYVAGDSLETYRLSDTFEPSPKQDFSHLIHILDDEKMNSIGVEWNTFSKRWYMDNTYSGELKKLKNNLFNFFHNIEKSPSSQNMWTTYCKDTTRGERCPDWRKMLSGNGYSKGFLACNAKGTNNYRHKTTLAYTVNIFPNACLANFLHAKGIPLNRDMYATSEMVQWIWRSAIRDGKEITAYVPSSRMRRLLMNWIEACKTGGIID